MRDEAVTRGEFARQSWHFWRSEIARALPPADHLTSKAQPETEFLAQFDALLDFFDRHELPLLPGEALIAGGVYQSYRLTNFRLIITDPARCVVAIPLAEVQLYRSVGAEGSLRGLFFGPRVDIVTPDRSGHWSGAMLHGLQFPRTGLVHGLLRLAAWRGITGAGSAAALGSN